jgi:hypothetical protein
VKTKRLYHKNRRFQKLQRPSKENASPLKVIQEELRKNSKGEGGKMESKEE